MYCPRMVFTFLLGDRVRLILVCMWTQVRNPSANVESKTLIPHALEKNLLWGDSYKRVSTLGLICIKGLKFRLLKLSPNEVIHKDILSVYVFQACKFFQVK